MSEEKKQLNDEELEQVSGGSWAEDHDDYLPANHGAHIGKYAASGYIGQKVYAVNDSHIDQYCFGKLINSYEKDIGLGGTSRVHIIQVESASCETTYYKESRTTISINLTVGAQVEIPGDDFTIYLEK